MKKGKKTIEQVKAAFAEVPYGIEFSRAEIIKIVTDLFGKMEVIPSDYCYNRVNDGIDLEKNIQEQRCLFEYVARNRYKYIGAGRLYNGILYHKPKSGKEYVAGKINNGMIEWYT